MFKVVALLTRKQGLSREAFVEYYETRHVPLIRSLFPYIADYRRNYVDLTGAIIESGTTAPDFDSVTELWFHDRAGYEAMMKAHASSDAGPKVAQDEENFLDRSKTRFFIVEERGVAAQ
jgi:uncharacterized protein (TIGR02118 family)